MKLNDFLNEHSEWIANNVPGEYPYSDVRVGQASISSEEFETLDVGEDPHVTINEIVVAYPNE